MTLRALGELTALEQEDTIARAYGRAQTSTLTSVMHTAQDFADREDHPALRWLDGLAERCESIDDLMQLADAFPHQTLALRERAAAITAEVANRLQSATKERANPDGLAARARWLNDLSVRLSALDRQEEALSAAGESAAIYRELATLRPEAGGHVPGSGVARRWGAARERALM